MTWKLVSDSSSDLITGQLTSPVADFEVVPLCLRVGEKEFWDTAELDVSVLLQAMAAEKGPSGTACPSPEAFAEVFRKADRTICTTISQNLSGTYNAACLGREMVLEEFPEKKIAIIDSFATAGEEVLILRKAKALIEEDPERDFEELEKTLYDYQQSLETVFTLENFDNLVKNGRMKPLVGTLLQSLGIHVIADAAPEGVIRVRDKARGEKKTFERMVKLMREAKDPSGAEVIIAHCNNPDGAQRLRELILKELPVKSVELIPTRGLCSFYAMDQGLIVGF
ncbi:MAG: DegV family protein [Oscillibacter sp.]|nr:DegV family protein [Oscillibacter sp.]